MRAILAVLLLVSPVLAQNPPTDASLAPGCGAMDASFEVKTERAAPLVAQPDTGKALVYFVEDDSEFGSKPKPTPRAGIDGRWVGAMHGDSYFSTAVDPGE